MQSFIRSFVCSFAIMARPIFNPTRPATEPMAPPRPGVPLPTHPRLHHAAWGWASLVTLRWSAPRRPSKPKSWRCRQVPSRGKAFEMMSFFEHSDDSWVTFWVHVGTPTCFKIENWSIESQMLARTHTQGRGLTLLERIDHCFLPPFLPARTNLRQRWRPAPWPRKSSKPLSE